MRPSLFPLLIASLSVPMLHADTIPFQKTCLDKAFRSEGVAVGDINRDGKPDILAGEMWYEAPDWTPHEIQAPGTYDPNTGYSKTFAHFARDVNGDGWVDSVITTMMGEPCWWFENPKGEEGHWTKHLGTPSACNETPLFADLHGSGKRVLVCGVQPGGFMAWFEIPEGGGDAWIRHDLAGPKAPGSAKYGHGLGVGDLNGDGRNDVIVTKGWWEAPEDRTAPDWTFHPADLGPDCADMVVLDVDGDGDADLLSSSAHNYGVWWHEQQPGTPHPTFVRHTIDETLSQTHSLRLCNLDGEGLPEIITGKRYFAHNGKDPGSGEPALLVYYRIDRKPGGEVTFTRHTMDEDCGVGTQFAVADLNDDQQPDIAISNKKGVHVLIQPAP